MLKNGWLGIWRSLTESLWDYVRAADACVTISPPCDNGGYDNRTDLGEDYI